MTLLPRWPWLAALGLAFVGNLVANLPARHALIGLAPAARASLSDVAGTLWQGSARLALGSTAMDARWTLRPLSLLLLAPSAELELAAPELRFVGRVTRRAGGILEITGGTLDARLGALARLAGPGVGALDASVEVRELALVLAGGKLSALGCTGAVRALTAGPRYPLGDLSLDCATDAGGPTLRIEDGGGALALQARVAITPDGRFLVDGSAGARPGAPPELAAALPLLGTAIGPDQVRFRYAGALPGLP